MLTTDSSEEPAFVGVGNAQREFFESLYALNIRKGIYPREDRLEPGEPVVAPDEEFSPEP